MTMTLAKESNMDALDDPALENLRQMFFGGHHPLFNAMSVTMESLENGSAAMSMPFIDGLADASGALHRGTLVTLADTASGLAIFTSLRSLVPIATVDLRVDYASPIPPGVGIVARMHCHFQSRAAAHVKGEVYACNAEESLLASISGVFAVNTPGKAFK